MSDSPVRPAPERLADFEVIRRLGAGGMAEVFLAKKRGAEGTYKLLVVKRILPAHGSSRRFRTMFAEEAQLATRLNHPNIVQVYDFQNYGEEGHLLSMEYVEGPDLRKVMRAAKQKGLRLPPFVAAHVIAEVAKGLHYAHERRDEGGAPLDIVHRDVSPQNVLVSFEGAVKIADFGIATASLFREEPGVLKGKSGYMSPEQARAERVDRRTDIYSLGVMLHELLTGRPLHGAAEGQDLLEAVRAGAVEPPSMFVREVPQELEQIVMRALAKNREDRFQTARDMASAITRSLFQKQVLVDSHVVEGVVGQLVSREHTSPGVDASADPAEGEGHDASAEGAPPSSADLGSPRSEREATGPGRPVREIRGAGGREVRHVAVVTVRLLGVDDLEDAIGASNAIRFGEQLRATLEEIAYKHGARLSWEAVEPVGRSEAAKRLGTGRAVVGLMANPARAALDAAWLAVDIHEAIHGASDDMPVELQASIGIVRGIATGERDKAGHLVAHELAEPAHHLASLLGARAPSGATWVAGGFYRLVRRDFIWGDAPTIEIEDAESRDLPRHMRIYALERPLTREERTRALALASTDLVGRDTELAELQAAYHRAVKRSDGTLGQVTSRAVIGEMGIGKTALVNAFLAELPPDARVLRVECSPAHTALPFGNVAQWIRELTGLKVDAGLHEAREAISSQIGDFATGRHGADMVDRLSRLVTGAVATAQDEADVSMNRRLVAAGLRRFFARAALQQPLVVIIEGGQWADKPSLELVSQLVRRGDPMPILALLVTRPSDRVLSVVEGMVRIELQGLSAENQIRLLQTRLGVSDGVRQVCGDLVPRAAGNPFFLLEMVDALLERGSLEIREREDGTQELARLGKAEDGLAQLPSTLEQLIGDRLGELPPEESAIVMWLAVNGGPLREAALAQLTSSEPGDAIARLCARGLCDAHEDSVDVRHPLIRDVAYLSIEFKSRARMHGRLGEHLAQTSLAKGLPAAIVARHLSRGGAKARAADFYLEAAQAARASYQMQLATRYYRRAIKHFSAGNPALLDAHEALEAIARVQGRWRDRRRHLAALRRLARDAQSPRWVAVALLRTARMDLEAGRLSRALTAAQRAEGVARAAGSSPHEVEAQLLMAETLRDLGDMQGALSSCDRAIATAAADKVSARWRADVLRTRGTLLRRVGRVHEAVEAHAEAIAICRRAGARRLEARAKNSLAFAMFVLGRFEDGIALALDAIRIDLAIGGRFQIAKTLSNIGQSYARLGDVPRALAYLKRARDAHERYEDQDARADTLLCTAEVYLETDDLDAADTLIRDAGALTAVTGSAYDSVHEKILRALLAVRTGDPGAAVMHAFDARQAAEAQAYVAFHFYAMAAEAAARVAIGEQHTGILLATTAMGTIETVQGSEYGLETRSLCYDALAATGSPQAVDFRERATGYVRKVGGWIRDPAMRKVFVQRKPVLGLMGGTPETAARAIFGDPAPDAENVRSGDGMG